MDNELEKEVSKLRQSSNRPKSVKNIRLRDLLNNIRRQELVNKIKEKRNNSNG